MTAPVELDRDVRFRVYRHFIATGRAPTARSLADLLSVDVPEIRASLQRLADAHALVLDPHTGELQMAHPFSATPTDYPVHARGITYWGNCAWDALGIPVLLGDDSVTETRCPDCGEGLTLAVRHGDVDADADVVHFLVPARDFWRDIGFT